MYTMYSLINEWNFRSHRAWSLNNNSNKNWKLKAQK